MVNTLTSAASLSSQLAPGMMARIALHLFERPVAQPKTTRGQPVLDQADALLTLQTSGGAVRVYRWGDGPWTVLLAHGWRAQAGSMSAFVEPLVYAGLRVVAFDAPAHANSPGQRLSVPQYAQVIADLLTQHAPIAGVIAHSMGAASTALAVADQAEVPVGRLVLMACPDALTDVLRSYAAIVKLSPRSTQRLLHHAQRRYGPLGRLSVAEAGQRIAARGWQVPLLLFHAPEDAVVPFRDAQRIQVAWADARLEAVPGLGHVDLLRDPQTVARAAAFITQGAGLI